ncbi:hypothetical protein [Candidatus Galacturonibacter soehngenii]|uniref:Uncharacterized protein n=1 Tax=Candidatus Galacturonatibacter soehngenii TaxID=2307010 RepID=A0A7V7QK27_9FIRM|nr:hypothetical protein [Candidatus Galacturonibacter soehngenii]KAB1437773.1 hypothetical protein F7O84_09260 [Candidatus Galacturonibacter soehngenii]MBA4687462.1 hypothetical protein [Candidatus Galacturonibacter soehngenii]
MLGEVINCRPKKTKKTYNKRLIRKRLEKKRFDLLVEQLEGKNGKDYVIVKKISFLAKLLELLTHSFYILVRILIWGILCFLITIGINTALNGQLRQQAMQVFSQLIGG